jgi:multiple sugar transport system permease protein
VTYEDTAITTPGQKATAYVVALVFAVVLIIPFLWVLLTSFTPTAAIFQLPPIKLFTPTLDHYAAVLTKPEFLRVVSNTLIVSLATAVITVVVGTLAAYAITRYRTGGRTMLYATLAIRTLPPVVLGLPMFVLFMRLNLIDTLTGLTVAYTAFMLPNTIWLMLAFFQDLPAEVEEAALVDGCTRFQAFRKIALPLARTGIAITALYNLIGAWNHFFFGLILANSNAKTLPVAAAELIGEHAIKWGEVSAIATLMIVPPLIIVVSLHRQIRGGLLIGGVKG